MFKQEEDRVNYLGSAVFVFLFYLLLYAFAENQDKRVDSDSDHVIVSQQHSAPTIIVEVQQIHFLNSIFPYVDNSKIKLFGGGYKLISDNNTIYQRIVFLERAELLIKPVILRRFFKQYHSIDTDDLPHLS